MSHADASAARQPATEGDAAAPRPSLAYYEFDSQAAPEVVLDGTGTQEKMAGAARDRPAAETATESDAAELPARASEVDEASEPRRPAAYLCWPWRWARREPYLAAAAATLGLGIVALIVLPIILHNVAHNRGDSSTSSLPGSTQTGPVPSATSTTTLPTAAQCTDTSGWAQNVSFLGISDSNGKTWPYKLAAASSAADCCTTCFANFPHGCQGWAYLPWNGTPVPCTIVYGWNSTQGVSGTCPDGKANITVTSSTGHDGSVGGPGPCGQESA